MFLKNYACDMLWAYSLSIVITWYGRIVGQSVWKSLAESICVLILLEFLQITPFVTGTFDVLDICVEILMAGIAMLISVCFYNYKDKD